jgi:hypothetical protein
MTFTKTIAAAAAIAVGALLFTAPAKAGSEDAIIAGTIGFAAGTIFGGAMAQPGYYAYPPPPPPVYVAPVMYVPQPWTPQWYAACHAKYISFNPATGMFKAKGGKWKFCHLP